MFHQKQSPIMFSITYIRSGFRALLGAGLIVLGSFSAWCQDPQFSHFFSSSLHHNPAFAGVLGTSRATLVHRSQWPRLANINTTLFSADGLLAKEKVGLGCIISHHKQDGWFGRTEVAVPLAFRIMADEWTLSMAVQPGVTSRSVGGLDGMTFVDQYAALNNGRYTPNSADPLALASFRDTYFSVGAGFLFDYFRSADHPRFWIGGSAHQGAYPLGYDVKSQPSHWSRIRKSVHVGVQFMYGDPNGQQDKGEKHEKALSLIGNIRNQYFEF
jgi:type IX secretion system PorP/SprF family membrane protein